MTPLVSIVIPTFNQCQYLHQAVSSALSQDYKNLEVLVIDDGSSDDTSGVVEQFKSDPRFKYFRNKQNLGRVGNYRHGLFDCVTGDYVLNLDGDDWLTDNQYIQKAADILDQYPEVGFVVARAQTYIESEDLFEDQLTNHKTGIVEGIEYLNDVFSDKIVFAHLAALYRRKDAVNSGFYSVDSMWTDGISFFRLATEKKVALLPQNVGIWRLHDSNESSRFYQKASSEEVFEIISSITDICDQLSSEVIESYIYLKTYHYLAWAVKAGEFEKVFSMLKYLESKYPEFLWKKGLSIMGRLGLGFLLYIPRRLLR